MPRHEVALLQAIIDSHDHLGRIRTERNEGDRALIVIMYCAPQHSEILEMIQGFEETGQLKVEFI